MTHYFVTVIWKSNKQTKKKKVKGDKTYFAIVINDLDPFALGRNDPSTDSHVELSFGAGLDPHIITLKRE